MGNENDCLLECGLESEELVLHLPPNESIEGGERLVKEPDVGFDGQGAADAHPLLLAAGEFPGVIVTASMQSDQVDDL